MCFYEFFSTVSCFDSYFNFIFYCGLALRSILFVTTAFPYAQILKAVILYLGE